MKVGFWDIGAVILSLGLAGGAFFWTLTDMPEVPQVSIRAENRDFLYLLEEDRELEFQGPLGITSVVIKDGRVRVTDDPGPRKISVNTGWIDQVGQTIISLPNAVFIRIIGPRKENELDSVSY